MSSRGFSLRVIPLAGSFRTALIYRREINKPHYKTLSLRRGLCRAAVRPTWKALQVHIFYPQSAPPFNINTDIPQFFHFILNLLLKQVQYFCSRKIWVIFHGA
jgi:hypothetical protein